MRPPVVRAVQARLLGLEDAAGRRPKVCIVRLVVDDGPHPRVLMHDGEPFVLFARQGGDGAIIYAQERAVRVDPGMIIEGGGDAV